MAPRVLIIVLCYNGVNLTLACLESLGRISYPDADVLVVDNASSDGTPAKVRAAFPQAELIETGVNGGFAAGNNVGLRRALERGYDYALLLNNDTEVAPDFLDLLVTAAEADPHIGAVGPLICYYERPEVIWSAGGLIDWRNGTSSMRGIGERDAGQYAAPAQVDFVTGCALLCRRAALQRAGLLDERFFMYGEDFDICARLALAGWKLQVGEDLLARHEAQRASRTSRRHLYWHVTSLLKVWTSAAFWRYWRRA